VDWITTYPFGLIYQEHLGSSAPAGHPATNGPVVIGNCAWIGSNATIMSGVSISDGAIIAANATVTEGVGPYKIVVGNPAKLIRKRFEDTIIKNYLSSPGGTRVLNKCRKFQVSCAVHRMLMFWIVY